MMNKEKMIILGKYNINYMKKFLNEKLEIYSDNVAIANISDVKNEAENLGIGPEMFDINPINIEQYKLNQYN